MSVEITKELIIGAAGAGGALFLRWLVAWYKSGDRAKAKAEAVGRASAKRDEALSRRAEDRYVLKEVCEECDEKRKIESESLRSFIQGVNASVQELKHDLRENREVANKIYNQLLENG